MRRVESVGEYSLIFLVSIEFNVVVSKINNVFWIRFVICRVCKDIGIVVELIIKDNIKNELVIIFGIYK